MSRKLKCKNLFYVGLGQEKLCGEPAVYRFDQGKRTGYAICSECAKHYHPKRLTPITYKNEGAV